jgi:hypothetical protein
MKLFRRILLIATILNFVVFCTVALMIGGDALNGKVENERYFVADKNHYREVSPAVFQYSRLHAVSVLITIPVVVIAYAFSAWGSGGHEDKLQKRESS